MKLRRRVKLRKTNPEALEPLTLTGNIDPFGMEDKLNTIPKLEEPEHQDSLNSSIDSPQKVYTNHY